MTKEQFQQWAMAVVLHVEQGKEESAQFAGQVEEHDKEAAALLRTSLQAGQALADHLRSRLDDGSKG